MFFNHEETASEFISTLIRRMAVIGICVLFLVFLTKLMTLAQAQGDVKPSTERTFSIFGPSLTPSPSPTPTASPTPTPTPVQLPASISIPSIGIENAPTEYLSITQDGSMETPHQSSNAGWLQLGPKPGEVGSSIISGHYDDQYGQPAVFYNLKYVQKGADIIVHMADGSDRQFVVDFVGEVDAYGNNIDAITRQTEYPSLTLVTCHGTWDVRNHIYSKRLVVYASMK